MRIQPEVIDVRALTRGEQEAIRNQLFVNGERVFDYDRFRSWEEPKADNLSAAR